MKLTELQGILGERIKIATNKDLTSEKRKYETEINQTIASLAKQMINNDDIILRADGKITQAKIDSVILRRTQPNKKTVLTLSICFARSLLPPIESAYRD